MTLGAICRADSGGLGIQTRQIVDLIKPDKVLVIDMGAANRGPCHEPPDAPEVKVTAFPGRGPREATDFLSECSVVYSAESLYWPGIERRVRRTRWCVHANPELPRHDQWGPTITPALPTTWHHAAHPHWPVVPHPSPWHEPAFCEVRRLNLDHAWSDRVVLHHAAPAMLDRNGTVPLMDGLRAYDGPPFTLRVCGTGLDKATRGRPDTDLALPRVTGAHQQVTVQRVMEVPERADLYRGVDLMVLPRRYAGNCLPAYEAAAAGVPVLMTDLDPQDEWPGVDASIVCGRGQVVRMQGGRFRVADPDPVSVAEQIARHLHHDRSREAWRAEALAWAESLSWSNVRPSWERWLGRPLPDMTG